MTTTDLRGKRVLYIEDDRNNREIVQTALEAFGAQVEFDPWAFPEITVGKIRRNPPDLILLDLMFPNHVSGYDIVVAMRRDEHLHMPPIVAVSAADPTIEIPRAQERGLQGYLAKPINVMELEALLVRVLNGEAIWKDS